MAAALALAIATTFAFSGCASSSSEVRTGGASKPGDPSLRTLVGVMTYTPLPRRKSVQAYMGIEFTIAAGPDKVILAESQVVPRERLLAVDGKRIKVTCRMRAGAPPHPRSSYPVGPDGKPLARPAKCVVSTLDVL